MEKLKQQGVDPSWIEAYNTRIKLLEDIQGKILDSDECEEEKEKKG